MRKILNVLVTVVFVGLLTLTIYLGKNYFSLKNTIEENQNKINEIDNSITSLEEEKSILEEELETLASESSDEVKEYELWKRKTEELKEKVSL